jgi:hypothetical protein
MALDLQSGTIQLLSKATEVSRTRNLKKGLKLQSWMVQLYIKLLAGSPGSNPGRGALDLEMRSS